MLVWMLVAFLSFRIVSIWFSTRDRTILFWMIGLTVITVVASFIKSTPQVGFSFSTALVLSVGIILHMVWLEKDIRVYLFFKGNQHDVNIYPWAHRSDIAWEALFRRHHHRHLIRSSLNLYFYGAAQGNRVGSNSQFREAVFRAWANLNSSQTDQLTFNYLGIVQGDPTVVSKALLHDDLLSYWIAVAIEDRVVYDQLVVALGLMRSYVQQPVETDEIKRAMVSKLEHVLQHLPAETDKTLNETLVEILNAAKSTETGETF